MLSFHAEAHITVKHTVTVPNRHLFDQPILPQRAINQSFLLGLRHRKKLKHGSTLPVPVPVPSGPASPSTDSWVPHPEALQRQCRQEAPTPWWKFSKTPLTAREKTAWKTGQEKSFSIQDLNQTCS